MRYYEPIKYPAIPKAVRVLFSLLAIAGLLLCVVSLFLANLTSSNTGVFIAFIVSAISGGLVAVTCSHIATRR